MTGARVLCVDDEPIIRMVVVEILSELGCEVVEAESGEHALRLSETDDFDILITDIRMDGMNGWELAERARERSPALPVIYISGYACEGRRMSNTLFLAKPFMPHQLRTAVDACIAQRWTGAHPAAAGSRPAAALDNLI